MYILAFWGIVLSYDFFYVLYNSCFRCHAEDDIFTTPLFIDFYQKYIFLEFSYGEKIQNVAYTCTP